MAFVVAVVAALLPRGSPCGQQVSEESIIHKRRVALRPPVVPKVNYLRVTACECRACCGVQVQFEVRGANRDRIASPSVRRGGKGGPIIEVGAQGNANIKQNKRLWSKAKGGAPAVLSSKHATSYLQFVLGIQRRFLVSKAGEGNRLPLMTQ